MVQLRDGAKYLSDDSGMFSLNNYWVMWAFGDYWGYVGFGDGVCWETAAVNLSKCKNTHNTTTGECLEELMCIDAQV